MDRSLMEKEFCLTMGMKFPNKELPSFIKKEELSDDCLWRKNCDKLKYGDHFLYQSIF